MPNAESPAGPSSSDVPADATASLRLLATELLASCVTRLLGLAQGKPRLLQLLAQSRQLATPSPPLARLHFDVADLERLELGLQLPASLAS